MELRQLRYFVAVADDLNFSRAAARLHVAQPSVSAQIKELERELGVPLFDRTSRAVGLTASGQDILPLARGLLEDARVLREQAQLSARRLQGRLRIGFLADEYADRVGEHIIAAMRQEHPRVEIEFHQVDFAEHHVALADGRVDVAFVMGPVPADVMSVPIGSSPRLLAVSRSLLDEDAGLAAGSGLAGQAVVLPNQMAWHDWRRAWTPPHAPAGQVFVVGEDSMEAMLSAVGARRGVAVVPEYVSRFYPQPGVTFLSLDELTPAVIKIAVMRSRSSEPLVGALMELAREALQDMPDRGAGGRGAH